MEFKEVVKARRSIRKYEDKKIESTKLSRILEAGVAAPSSGNLQNYRFVVVVDPEKKQNMAEVCARQFWMAKAPVIIVVYSINSVIKKFYKKRWDIYARHNCAMAAENILLAATNEGLGSCVIGAFDEEQLTEVIGGGGEERPELVITLGYPAEEPTELTKEEISNMVYLEKFGNKIEDMAKVLWDYGIITKRALKKGAGKTKEGVKNLKEKILEKKKEKKMKKEKKRKGEKGEEVKEKEPRFGLKDKILRRLGKKD